MFIIAYASKCANVNLFFMCVLCLFTDGLSMLEETVVVMHRSSSLSVLGKMSEIPTV